jgi:hypothetical protein
LVSAQAPVLAAASAALIALKTSIFLNNPISLSLSRSMP